MTSDGTTYGKVIDRIVLKELGLSITIVRGAIQYTHETFDRIDNTLVQAGNDRLAALIELANLSAIVGNFFRRGISTASNGAFMVNRPHTFPDLLAMSPGSSDLEIKVALEDNNPKGHLIKPGPHIVVRYVLADDNGQYTRGKGYRGNVVWIWEVRVGLLKDTHFNFSNTEGDSGKTAVINAAGMAELEPVFIDLPKCPYSPKGPTASKLAKLYESKTAQFGCSRDCP